MKRFILCMIVISCVVFSACTDSSGTEEWMRLDGDYYSMIKAGDSYILVRRMQERDYQYIEEQLIDNDRAPDTASAEIAAADPDAFLPHNMLPDGRFLLENWEEVRDRLYKELSDVRRLEVAKDGFSVGDIVKSEVLPDSKLLIDAGAVHVITKDGSLLVPDNFDYLSVGFMAAPSGEYTLFIPNSGMLRADRDGTVRTLSAPLYNGKTYDQLTEEAIELYGGEVGKAYVVWNGQVSISPDGSYIAYVSNKGDLSGTDDLFVMDSESGEETLLRDEKYIAYGVNRWLDNDHIICTRMGSEEYSTFIMSKDGVEYDLKFSVDSPVVLGARDGVIAYCGSDCGTVYFSRFTEAEGLTDIGRVKLNGTLRVRPGIDPFSPDGSKFACILVPDKEPDVRDINIIDLSTMKQKINSIVPFGTKDESTVLEFDWIDNDAMLTSVVENQSENISSWIYRIKG